MILFTLATLIVSNLLASPLVIYGNDDRADIRDVDYKYQFTAQSVAAQISKEKLTKTNSSYFKLKPQKSLKSFASLEQDQKFSSQNIGAGCSAFLVSPGIIATAGHCVESTNDCKSNYWVFNYRLTGNKNSIELIHSKDIVTCRRIIKSVVNFEQDYALIEINQKQSRPYLEVQEDINEGDNIYMLGFPSGLPMKLASHASIMKVLDYSFKASLDAFALNSGSPVISERTHKVVGILVNGAIDYVKGDSGYIVNKCNQNGSSCTSGIDSIGEGVSRVNQFLKDLYQSI